jgi:hypothetical protein
MRVVAGVVALEVKLKMVRVEPPPPPSGDPYPAAVERES